jgi:AraC-type transcriptional regulator N-terminus
VEAVVHECDHGAAHRTSQEAKRAVLGDRVFDYPAGKYLILGIELPMVANVVQASFDEPSSAWPDLEALRGRQPAA